MTLEKREEYKRWEAMAKFRKDVPAFPYFENKTRPTTMLVHRHNRWLNPPILYCQVKAKVHRQGKSGHQNHIFDEVRC